MNRIFIALGVVLLLGTSSCSLIQRFRGSSTKKYSQQNSKKQKQRQEEAKKNGNQPGAASSDLPKDDVNYKDIEKIRAQCLYVKKNGKRCTRKAGKKKYCFWHNGGQKYK